MNTNKPTWNKDAAPESLRQYAAWLNDNARTMFLNDHAHMEIIFLLGQDGQAATIPVSADQDRDRIMQSVTDQIKKDNTYAVIHIAQLMTPIPGSQTGPTEAVVLTAESRDGDKLMMINEIIETETELSLAESRLFEAPVSSDAGSFFS